MPQLHLTEVLDATSKDVRNPPENMTRRKMAGKWLCPKGEVNHTMSATYRLSKLASIGHLDIGNFGSASVSVLVSRSGSKDFKQLVPSIVFRTEAECRNGEKKTTVELLNCGQLREDTRHEKWDLVQIVCCQPYRRPGDEQFGLSFIVVHEASTQSPATNSVQRLKESAFSSFSSKALPFTGNMTRAQKMIQAAKTSPTHSNTTTDEDLFKATVISFLDANANIVNSKTPSDAKSELMQKLQGIMEKKFNLHESKLFSQIFRNYSSTSKEILPSRILTPRTSNNQTFTSSGLRKMEDTKMSLLKPQINESFNRNNTQTVYWAEVVHNHPLKDGPVSYMGRNGKENTPFLLEKNGLMNGAASIEECPPALCSEKKLCFDQNQREKVSPTLKSRNDIDKCGPRDCSPDTWLKRKSESTERSLSSSKKRPRESISTEENGCESSGINRVTPSAGWLLNGTGLQKKKHSPDVKKDEVKFPFRVSPPPPPDRPASPLPLVDDIDQPSTSSRETVAERNIRLDLERRLAERSPPERVVQRTSAGKVKGPFCTKGMNTNDSPLSRLSICDENDEAGSPQARRKLSFVRQNGHDGDNEDLAECPVCRCYFEGCDINKHMDECGLSPIKRVDDGENDDEMACPICGLWQPKDTVAAHADECAQKRYGA